MNRKSTAVSAALSLALLVGTPAFAQVQVSEAVAGQLAALGIDETLIVTEEQLLEIEALLSDASQSQVAKKQAINTILAK